MLGWKLLKAKPGESFARQAGDWWGAAHWSLIGCQDPGLTWVLTWRTRFYVRLVLVPRPSDLALEIRDSDLDHGGLIIFIYRNTPSIIL